MSLIKLVLINPFSIVGVEGSSLLSLISDSTNLSHTSLYTTIFSGILGALLKTIDKKSDNSR